MPQFSFSLPKPTHNMFGKKISRRKAFKTQTKKKEWMKAGGHNPDNWRKGFIRTSKCRHCPQILHWGDRSYEFDHKNNNNSNNSQGNCFLVCRVCHGKATVVKKKKVRDKYTGMIVGHKTIKKKVGYKKQKKRKTTKKRVTRRKPSNPFGMQLQPKVPKGFW
ncbi:MAG: hypothetical protein NT001_06405 [Candidatus Woesearchaeota archaeon]|nr:hypothetical protein [Candidatus Woesearchaeota archaeon]